MKMNIDTTKFFTAYRREFGRILEHQVRGLDDLIFRINNEYGISPEHAAYVLATIKHETANTYQPIEEYGRGRKHKYGKPAGKYGHRYYGRGYVQLTWLYNYEKQSKKLGVDFVQMPWEVMNPYNSWKICYYGMRDGDFTGHKLSDYINNKKTDFFRARKIVNGMDRARLIETYAIKFLKILKESTI